MSWDYYFADLAAVAFFATQPERSKQGPTLTNDEAGAHRRWPRLTLFWASVITLVTIHQSTVRTAKHLVDNANAITRPLASPENIVGKDVFTIGWFERHEFILPKVDTSAAAPNCIDRTAYNRSLYRSPTPNGGPWPWIIEPTYQPT